MAKWRVHDQNRISAPRSEVQKLDDRLSMWMVLYKWCRIRDCGEIQQKIMNGMVLNVISTKRFGNTAKKIVPRKLLRLSQLLLWISKNPIFLADTRLWQSVTGII